MHSGPHHKNYSGPLEFLGLVHEQLTQKVKERKRLTDPSIKKSSPSAIKGLGFRPLQRRKKG